MKQILSLLIIVTSLLTNITAEESIDYLSIDSYLLEKGYTKFDPKLINSEDLFRETIDQVFSSSFSVEGISMVFLTMPDGLEYCFYYIWGNPFLPNLLSTVIVKKPTGNVGYYLKNPLLKGIRYKFSDLSVESETEDIVIHY